MLKQYPDFKKEIFIRIIIKPADGSDSPEEYRRVFRLIPTINKKRCRLRGTSFTYETISQDYIA